MFKAICEICLFIVMVFLALCVAGLGVWLAAIVYSLYGLTGLSILTGSVAIFLLAGVAAMHNTFE